MWLSLRNSQDTVRWNIWDKLNSNMEGFTPHQSEPLMETILLKNRWDNVENRKADSGGVSQRSQ